MTITATEVNKLRQQTGAGLMDCKKALSETGGDFEQAIDYLRKKGQKISASRADREAKEGVIIATTTPDNTKGLIVQISCETDFVAKNQDFIKFAQSVTDLALENQTATKESLLNEKLDGTLVKDRFDDQVSRIGEKIELVRIERLNGETVVPYIHAGYKIGVLVALNMPATPAIIQAGKDLAMQIAAMRPVAVDRQDVDTATIEREMEIGREIARNEGKPENIVDKIAQGKLEKFYKESTLVNQDYVKDSSKTVAQMLKEIDSGLKVTAFRRVALG